MSKLNEYDRNHVCCLYVVNGCTQKEIAERYDVSVRTIQRIIAREGGPSEYQHRVRERRSIKQSWSGTGFDIASIRPVGGEYQVTVKAKVGVTSITMRYMSESDKRSFEVEGPVTSSVSRKLYELSKDMDAGFEASEVLGCLETAYGAVTEQDLKG